MGETHGGENLGCWKRKKGLLDHQLVSVAQEMTPVGPLVKHGSSISSSRIQVPTIRSEAVTWRINPKTETTAML